MTFAMNDNEPGGRRGAFNFSAGPGALPEEVERALADDLLSGEAMGSKVPILGMSHRSPQFELMVSDTLDKARRLFGVPENFEVVLMQGGGSGQFAAVPLILGRGTYVESGYWSRKAMEESEAIHGQAPAALRGYSPNGAYEAHAPSDAYLMVVSNETADGLQSPLDVAAINHRGKEVPLVWDMSSDLGLRSIPASVWRGSKVVFAHAQKNWGPSGVTIVFVRRDALGEVPKGVPSILNWRLNAQYGSIWNTPPTFAIRALQLSFGLALKQGGVEAAQQANEEKYGLVKTALETDFWGYRQGAFSSTVSVAFNHPLAGALIEEAEANGFMGLAGHRSNGGVRISLYWGCEVEAAAALAEFLVDFERRYG